MKKSLLVSSLVVCLLLVSAFNSIYPLTSALWTVPVGSSVGFNDGSYLSFSSSMTFLTAVDGGATKQVPSNNASFGNWMFFQQQGSSEVYGFYVSGCSIVVTNYFVDSYLQFTADKIGVVKVYVGTLGTPVIASGQATGTFDGSTFVATISVAAAGSVRINFGGNVPGGGGGGGGGVNPTATPTATPTASPHPSASTFIYPTAGPTSTLAPLGGLDFQVDAVNLGTIHPNSSVTVNLHFRFSGSAYIIQTVSFSEPFQSWYVANPNLSSLTYILSGSESSGDVTLAFNIPDVALQSYGGGITVSALDDFGSLHTSSASISAVAKDSHGFDIVKEFQNNPLYAIVLVAAVLGGLGCLAYFSKRR
jgi:hypothetical protein